MDRFSSSSAAAQAWQGDAAGPSNLETPQMDHTALFSASTPTSSTPSRQTFPRRLSLLHNDVASPARASTGSDDAARKGARRLSLSSNQTVVSGAGPSSATVETPRRTKRSSISYISSPATDEGHLSRTLSNSSASGRTRTGSISRANIASRRNPSASQATSVTGDATSDADDWLMSEEDTSFSSATKSMAERDSAKVEALFNDTGYREGITAGKLSTLQAGFDQGFNETSHRASRRTLSLSSDESSSSRDLLRLIAEKERRCFELREELASEEASLQQLRSTWQRMATRELAYSAPSPTTTLSSRHRRGEGSTASSTGDVAIEAWNTLSSKLPGSFKLQLNNLLESIANVDNPPAEPIEKQSAMATKASPANVASSAGTDAAMLRPTYGSGLGVLEEEGSDVGSAALSPRSPRSPVNLGGGMPESNSTSPNCTITALGTGRATWQQPELQQPELASLAVQDSQALGFHVDSNGIAHACTAASGIRLIDADEEIAPSTPPKSEDSQNTSWTSRRTSVLGSLSSSLQSRLQSTSTSTNGSEETATFASMFAKRFKEARDNASDLLREAERKLGNAMAMDEFLNVASPAHASQRPRSPQITLDEASTDTMYQRQDAIAEDGSAWYAAAGGQPRRSSCSSRNDTLSAQTRACDSTRTDGMARLSISSSSSHGSRATGAGIYASPHLSPVIGGAPGAAGVFGMLMGSQSDLNRRASGDSWSWRANDDDDEDWQASAHDRSGGAAKLT